MSAERPDSARVGFLRRLAGEPLAHFLLLGGALFLVMGGGGEGSPAAERGSPDRRIVVSRGEIDRLVATFTRTWQRPPTSEELAGLVESEVRQEVLAREARAMGLDRDDPIVERRLAQKLEFTFEDLAAVEAPSDAELARFLSERPLPEATDPTVSLEQVFVNSDRRGAAAAEEARRLLALLNDRTDAVEPSSLGDPTTLPPTMADAPIREVEATFGPDFASRLADFPVGRWQGPVASGFGLHLVRVAARSGGVPIPGAERRARAEREWRAHRRTRVNARLYGELRSRYEVVVEGEESPSGAGSDGG